MGADCAVLKKRDVEVVRNSVRFAWHEVLAQFKKWCAMEVFQGKQSYQHLGESVEILAGLSILMISG